MLSNATMDDDKLFKTIKKVTILTGFTAAFNWLYFSTIFGIGLMCYNFNVRVFHIAHNLLNETLYDTDAEKTD